MKASSCLQLLPRLIFWLVALVSLVAGCFTPENTASDPAKQTFSILIDSDSPTGFKVTLPDGTVFTDPELYSQELPGLLSILNVDHLPVTFAITESIANDLDSSFGNSPDDEPTIADENGIGQVNQALDGGGSLGFGYYFSYSVNASKYIGGCVSNYAMPGGAARLRNSTSLLWDVHFGRYVKNGHYCLGLYESVSRWTRCTCLPTTTDMANGLYDVAIMVGVGSAAAWAIAQAMAPTLMFAVAL